jgi:chromosome segregation ATPase
MAEEDYAIIAPTEVITKESNPSQRKLLYQFSRTVGTNSSTADFKLQITDPDDPILLYDFQLCASKFQEIKRKQKLISEFHDFPRTFLGLLNEINSNGDSFRAQIDEHEHQQPKLMIQQLTKICLYITLHLTMTRANDTRLIEFLSGQTRFFKAGFIQSNARVRELEASAREAENRAARQLHEFSEEKAKLRRDCETRIREIQTEQEVAKHSLDQGFVTKEQTLIAKFESQIEILRSSLAVATEEKHRIDKVMQRQSERIALLEAQSAELKGSLQKCEMENRRLLTELSEGSKSIALVGSENEALKLQLAAFKKLVEDRELNEGRREKGVEKLKQALETRERELEEMRAEMNLLSQKAQERDWIAEKSKNVILKERQKLQGAISAFQERQQVCERLQRGLEVCQIRTTEAEETCKKLMIDFEQEKSQTQKLRNEVARLKEERDKLESSLAAERQFSQVLQGQLQKRKDLNQFQARMSYFEQMRSDSLDSVEDSQNGKGAEKESRKTSNVPVLKSIPPEFFARDEAKTGNREAE